MAKEESELKLAEAMDKLSEAINGFQDPVRWQKVFQDAIRLGIFSRPFELPQAVAVPNSSQEVGLGRIETISIRLSDGERDELVKEIHAKLEPQLAEFNMFVRKSLERMPPGRLKGLGDKLRAGVSLKLGQREGCIFVEAGDEDFYLGL